MRIGVYFGDFRPEIGGGYTYVTDLLGVFAEMIADSEHHYVMLCDPAAAHAMRLKVVAPNVTVVPVASPSWPALWLTGLKYFSPIFRLVWRRHGAVERTARRQGVQLLWFVGVDKYECPDMPYVATLWDLQHRLQPFFPEVSAAGKWDRREQFFGYFLRRAAYCITGTEAGKREIRHLYQLAEPRVRVLPLPTPRFALTAAPSVIDVQDRFGIDKRYIFYPAQFWPHKNHINLILALKWLREQRGLEILLALSGSDRGNLSFVMRFAEQQGVADQVRFLGFVSEEELVALYRQAVALTFVTYFGPDNIPPLEAFALGCPVIASAVEGAREQYGDAAVLVDPSDSEDIGRAIWNVHSDTKLRAKLVDAGFGRAGKWTSADYIRGMFKLFDEFSAIRRNWF
jgi:glycosyltransferase involved in cell wall biosynthesis